MSCVPTSTTAHVFTFPYRNNRFNFEAKFLKTIQGVDRATRTKMPNVFGNPIKVGQLLAHITSAHGGFLRLFGYRGSVLTYFLNGPGGRGKWSCPPSVDVFLALYLVCVISRIASRSLHGLIKSGVTITQWKLEMGAESTGADFLRELVVVAFNNYAECQCYIYHKALGSELEVNADASNFSVFGRVLVLRLHDVEKNNEYDPRHECFQQAFEAASSRRHRARAICVWVTTRSKSLLRVLTDSQPSDAEFLGNELFQCVKVAKGRNGGRRGGTVKWKSEMPPQSRDIGLNRVSSDVDSASYILRHVSVVEQMCGRVFATVDEMAEEFSGCSDTGCFLLQHYCWNWLLCQWCRVESIAVTSSKEAISKRNTLTCAERVVRDVSFERPKANHNVGFERDEHGHADIYAQFATEPEPKDAYELISEAHNALKNAAFDWKPTVRYRTSQGEVGQLDVPLHHDTPPVRCMFTMLCNMCMLEKVLKDILG